MYMVIYQKSNGEVFNRIRNTYPNYAIGETTSMGWIILDIKYNYDDKYYSFKDYKELLHKKYNIFQKVKNMIQLKK